MSYSLVGKFLTKEGEETQFSNLDFDKLKILNEQRYTVLIEGIEGFNHSQENSITTVCYRKCDFVEKLEDMKRRLKELENIQEKLNKIRYSSEYYNLSEDGQARFDTDSSYWKEELEDTECKVSALIYTIDVFNFVESILDKSDLILSISAL